MESLDVTIRKRTFAKTIDAKPVDYYREVLEIIQRYIECRFGCKVATLTEAYRVLHTNGVDIFNREMMLYELMKSRSK